MLAEETVRTIERLLNTSELSQREIARRMQVNRETVNRIANGKRFDVDAYRREKAAQVPRRIPESIRCHCCGHRIFLIPCQTCQLLRKAKHQRVKRLVFTNHGHAISPLAVDLKSKQKKRYLAIRARKTRRGENPANSLKLLSVIQNLGEQTMPTFQNVKYVRWFLSHIKELLPLLELPDQLGQASTIQEKWNLIKETGDIVVDVLSEFPLVEASEIHTQQDLELEVEAMGIPWQQLETLLPILIRLISLLQGEEE